MGAISPFKFVGTPNSIRVNLTTGVNSPIPLGANITEVHIASGADVVVRIGFDSATAVDPTGQDDSMLIGFVKGETIRILRDIPYSTLHFSHNLGVPLALDLTFVRTS